MAERQMLSIGGKASAYDVPLGVPDYLNLNGIGIFDLSSGVWANGFDADALPYERPSTIQAYYDQK